MNAPDVLVLGLGAMGSAVAYHAAKQGMKVVGIDQFTPPHAFGSTHGQSRITREAIGEGEHFVPLARRSHALWRVLESETGSSLFHACGGLILSRQGAASRMHAQDDFFGTTVRAAQRFGIAHEFLDAADIRARFPRFAVDDTEHGYFEPGAGWLDPEACVAAHLHRARALGAGLRFGERVEHIEAAESAIAVHTTSETYHPKKLIVAAGAWLPALCPEFARQQLVVRRQVMLWFESTVSMPHEPVFIWHWGERESDVFYGFPGRDGAIKMAAETLTGSTPPDGVDRNVSEDEFAAFYQRHARDRMTGVTPKGVGAATCLYTVAPRANFVIDALPGCTNAVAVSACSGHGFKHSAAIGEAVAQWLCTGKRPEVLGPFALPQS